MTSDERKKELPKALVRWYDMPEKSRVLCIVHKQGISMLISESFKEKGLDVTEVPLLELEGAVVSEGVYDYAVAADIVEYAVNAVDVLCFIRKMLHPRGKLLLAADNRFGIRYFCGDQDYFSGKVYDGIENYRHLMYWERNAAAGRAYSKSELKRILEEAGFNGHHFFSVFPRISNAQLLLAEDYKPNEALNLRIFPEYNNPDTVFLFEEELYPSLMENGLLHPMANGFFVECSLDTVEPSDIIKQVTLSGERGSADAMATIIHGSGYVEKRALYADGNPKMKKLLENNYYLSGHGVCMIEGRIEGESFVTPYTAGIPANDHFQKLLENNKEEFLDQLDAFWDIIQNSSEQVSIDEVDWEKFEPGWEKRKKDDPNKDKWKKIAHGSREEREALGVILKRGYLDLVSLNCFYINNAFVFYDQELYLENVPAKAIMLRTIEFIYKFNDQLDGIIPRGKLFERYKITEYMGLFQKFISKFLETLRNDDGLSDYFKEGRRDYDTVMENRSRMDFPEGEYPLIFHDIFHHTKGRRLYLFGTGKFAGYFKEKYGEKYSVAGYFDNNESLWGSEIDGCPVLNPSALRKMNPAGYKIMICIKDYLPVLKQLKKMKIPNVSVFSPNIAYKDADNAGHERGDAVSVQESKKYNVGYVAGVFDMFHIGHLNLLKRAKEQCNYLIVGIVTDEGVIKHKKSKPQILYEERAEIVRACRYVDKVVEIPLDQGDTDEAYRRYKFDVQFSGSDYVDDPKWMAKKEFLQMHGADLVFFPYTEGISTTMLKDKMKG